MNFLIPKITIVLVLPLKEICLQETKAFEQKKITRNNVTLVDSLCDVITYSP